MGTRLREIVKKTVVDTETKVGKIKRKSLSGKGKLTAKTIDKLTVYYGLAIRRYSDFVENMKGAILWVLSLLDGRESTALTMPERHGLTVRKMYWMPSSLSMKI